MKHIISSISHIENRSMKGDYVRRIVIAIVTIRVIETGIGIGILIVMVVMVIVLA